MPSVISLGGVVVHNSARIGGNKLDEAIANYIKKRHNLIIGDQTAEWVKIKIGDAIGEEASSPLDVKGRDAINGLPRTVTVSAKDVTEAICPRLLQIISTIKSVLEQVPPELSSDIIDRGIVMTGGTSLLKNFPKLVTLETGVPAYVAEDAILCVAKGTGIALENFENYKRAITSR